MSSLISISYAEVYQLLNWKVLQDELVKAFADVSKGKEGGVIQPLRTVIPIQKHNGFLGVMPAYSMNSDALAIKLGTFYPQNKDSVKAWILLAEPSSGDIKAIIDGVSVTAIRTAVASSVATKYLSNPSSKILAILGTGTQARSHIRAMSMVHKFDEVRVWGRTPANADKLAKQIGATACRTVQEAVHGADVICTVTSATDGPFLEAAWIKPGAHINAVGAPRPNWQEIQPSLMRSAVVYCDSLEACKEESGDVVLSKCDIYAEIGEVIMNKKEARWKETTIFKSVGMALEDVIAAKLVYEGFCQKKPGPGIAGKI